MTEKRANGAKREEGRFRSNVRKEFFIMVVVRHWNRLLREVVDDPPLEVLKAIWDRASSTLIFKMSFSTQNIL